VAAYLVWEGEVIASGKPKYISEEILKNHVGEIHVFDGLMVPIFVNNEQAVLFMARDNTERYNMERERRELRENLYRADRLGRGGEIAMALTHEISQPLTGILSNAQATQLMLAQKEPDLTEIANILADIVADVKHAGNVIKRLSSYLKKKKPVLDRIDVNEAILEIIKLLRSDSELKNVAVSTELAANLPRIMADRIQIQQVVLNLIMNAGYAMAEQPTDQRRITVKTFLDGMKAVMVSVCDTGPGIAQKNLPRLFDAHFTTKANGMGIGLAICHSILEAHDGRIWAENNPHGGATFMFSLPSTKKNRRYVKNGNVAVRGSFGGGVP